VLTYQLFKNGISIIQLIIITCEVKYNDRTSLPVCEQLFLFDPEAVAYSGVGGDGVAFGLTVNFWIIFAPF